MKWSRSAAFGALAASTAFAQEMSLCDMYTTALLKNNTAANQYTLITLVVNTALIGNYTKPNMNAVTGILVPGQYMGTNVTLLPYFNGGLVSTNRGNQAMAVNFLDGGGAIPLAENKAANDMTSNQYKLVTHLYEYFGALLQCSQYGKDMTAFPAYGGSPKMYEVHKFMNLDPNEMGYFIQEVGLAAASFGVSAENVTYIGTALATLFDQRCSNRTAVLPNETPDLQAICINSACPVATSAAICTSYNKMSGSGVQPATASMTSGPQLSDLAPQLSSIQAGLITPGAGMGGGAQSFSTTIITTSVNSTATTETSLIPIGGAVTMGGSTLPNSVIMSVTETTTSGSMTITTVVPTTEANPALISSAATVISSVITSGSSTYTTVISTSAAVSTATKAGAAAPAQTAGLGLVAVVGVAGLVGQML